jgi:predicted Zn-ribbon and HTH transcriptional regulator
MSLGRREARHQTSAAAKVAGVEPSADWDFHPGQRVQTVDGLPGRVTAVQDGPVRGAEGYEVTLDDGMGGGLYTSSQLAPAPETTASLQETAAADYPELEEVLATRPDIARNTVLGSLKEAINDAEMSQASSERAGYGYEEPDHVCNECSHEFVHSGAKDERCPHCGSTDIYEKEEEDRDDQDDYYSQGGGHEDNYGDPYGKMDAYHDFKNSSLKTAADGDLDDDGPDGYGPEVYCTDCHEFHGENRHSGSASPAKDYDGVDTSVGGNTLSNGMSSSSDSASNSATSTTSAKTASDNPIHLPPEVTPEIRDNWLAGGHPGFDEHGHSKYNSGRWRNSPSECVKSGEHMSLEGGPGYANGTGTCARCGDTAEPTIEPAYQQLMLHKAMEGHEEGYKDGDYLLHQQDPHPEPPAPKAAPEPIVGYPKDLVDQIPKATPEQTKFLDSNPTGPTKYSKIASADEYSCGTDHWAGSPRERLGDTDCGHPECPYRPCDHPWCVKNEPEHNVTEHNMAPPGHLDPYSDESQESEKRLKDALAPHHEELGWQFEQRDPYEDKGSGPSKYSALDIFDPFDILVTASMDPDFRFEVTAAWSDVRNKAKRIRTTGGVHVTLATEGMIFAEVKGDHHVYETGLQTLPGKHSVQSWSCGCKWGAYHWGAADDFSRFAGRMCSHALALQFEAQSRGMFGKSVEPDMEKPSWVPRRVVVKYDIDADQNRSAKPTYPDYGRVAGLSALSVLSSYAKAEGMTGEDFIVECVKAGLTAAVNSPWGEPQPEVPEVTGPTRPPHATDNPASQGFASQPDPKSWDNAISPDTIGMAASLDRDEFLFEADLDKESYARAIPLALKVVKTVGPSLMAGEMAKGGDDKEEAPAAAPAAAAPPAAPTGAWADGDEEARASAKSHALTTQSGGGPTGTGGSMTPDAGPESTLHDEPEAALPQTDGELDLGSGLPLSNGSPDGGSLGAGSVNIKGDPKSLESDTPSIMSTGGVDDIVASFQQKAAHLDPMSGNGDIAGVSGNGDIAAAARETLAKMAVKDFTPGEQATIINEGQGVTAANLDRLDIAGTHYEPLEAALAARDAEEDDDAWMA